MARSDAPNCGALTDDSRGIIYSLNIFYKTGQSKTTNKTVPAL